MLDLAVERAEDEATIKAVRTEQRKINEDGEKLAREMSRVSSGLRFNACYALC